jgi:hypothetical protein
MGRVMADDKEDSDHDAGEARHQQLQPPRASGDR